MTSYVAFTPDYLWIEFGGHQECCSLAEAFTKRKPDETAYVGRIRAGESYGRYVYAFTADKPPTRVLPAKYFKVKPMWQAHSALRGVSDE